MGGGAVKAVGDVTIIGNDVTMTSLGLTVGEATEKDDHTREQVWQ